jgi:hypothetical protein
MSEHKAAFAAAAAREGLKVVISPSGQPSE